MSACIYISKKKSSESRDLQRLLSLSLPLFLHIHCCLQVFSCGLYFRWSCYCCYCCCSWLHSWHQVTQETSCFRFTLQHWLTKHQNYHERKERERESCPSLVHSWKKPQTAKAKELLNIVDMDEGRASQITRARSDLDLTWTPLLLRAKWTKFTCGKGTTGRDSQRQLGPNWIANAISGKSGIRLDSLYAPLSPEPANNVEPTGHTKTYRVRVLVSLSSGDTSAI